MRSPACTAIAAIVSRLRRGDVHSVDKPYADPEGRGDDATTDAAWASAGASSARTQGASIAALWRRLRTPRCAASAAVLVAAVGVAASLPSAHAETIQHGDIRVTFDGQITPKRLPRTGTAPVSVAVSTMIGSIDSGDPPQLTRIQLAINAAGHIDPTGLPVCEVADIQPSTTQKALQACPGSKVGEGTFSATVALTSKVAFPTTGRLIAFNGVIGCSPFEKSQFRADLLLGPGRGWPSSPRTQEGRGGERAPARDPNATDRGQRDATCHPRPAILAHVYGTDPLPTSFTLPFVIGATHGTFGTTLTATLPPAEGNFLTGIELNLHRTFTYRGKARSYASAGCPAPKGFPGAVFPFAKATYAFAGGARLTSILTRSCQAR
jgi:hypothetical protein